MREEAIKYGTEKRQEELLEMIKQVDKILKENSIRYSLCGGTLLGAVRHHGFIPWDDDIDIMVDRDNYMKLVQLFQKTKNLEFCLNRQLWIYRIQKKNETRSGLTAPTIDVFVMDHCPDNLILRKMKVFLVKILQGMMKEDISTEGFSLFYRICLIGTYYLGKLFSYNTKFQWYEKVSQIGNSKKTEFLTGYNDLFKLLNLKYKSNLLKEIQYHKFEDTKLPITKEYDSYLTTQYGDYMTPPAECERIPQHNAL